MKHPGLTNIVKEDSNEVFEWSEDSFIKAKKLLRIILQVENKVKFCHY